jgi:hypothetical protein
MADSQTNSTRGLMPRSAAMLLMIEWPPDIADESVAPDREECRAPPALSIHKY